MRCNQTKTARPSLSRARAGRKSWATRTARGAALNAAALCIAQLAAPVRSTDGWTVDGEMLDGSARVVWNFARFYAHAAEWTAPTNIRNPAFSILDGFAFGDAIADILASGATIYTAKAKFKLQGK